MKRARHTLTRRKEWELHPWEPALSRLLFGAGGLLTGALIGALWALSGGCTP